VGAAVQARTESGEFPAATRTDDAGRFQLQSVFGNGCCLHAISADGNEQTILSVPSGATRTALSTALELKLLPSLHHDVIVHSEGRQVAGAQVAATGDDFEVQGVTGADGKIRLAVPWNGQIRDVIAWHPRLGASGRRFPDDRHREAVTQLSLAAPAPFEIRVIDVDGKPVGGVELGVAVATEDPDWFFTSRIRASHVRTDDLGSAIVPWAPREKLRAVQADVLDSRWKVDESDLEQIKSRIMTVHARREQTVNGRLIMPEGSNALGILVTGFGFGPARQGDRPYARARRDGTFSLRVPSEHGFVLGIDDLKWASNLWTGLILSEGSAKPAEIVLTVYPATPLTIRVTRGPRRDPVADAWVDLSSQGEVHWTDRSGAKQSGMSGVRSWLTTDALGVVRTGVGKGSHELRLSSGNWNEERTITVTSEKPVECEFHRPWIGQRRVTARLVADGAPFVPARSLEVRAWTPQDRRPPIVYEPVMRPDGTFEVLFDAPALSLFVVDREQKRSGFLENIGDDDRVDLAMVPLARSYSGTLLDDRGKPISHRGLELDVKTSRYHAAASHESDEKGRFRFTDLPANVPLQLNIQNESKGPQYFLFDRDRMFNPGEVRENDVLSPKRVDETSSSVRPNVPPATRVDNACRNARSAGMRALVAVLGDDSQGSAKAVDQLFDDDNAPMRAVLSYLTLRVDSIELKREAATVAKIGWPTPGSGEIVLVALDGDQTVIAAQRIPTNDVAAAVGIGFDFLKQHRPPAHNALTLLAEARNDAKRSGRRVWVIEGGPRCGPCFRLARWIDDHRATIEKDFVVVKLMAGIDQYVADAVAGLPIKEGDGIPWFAFTEPDGAILAISRGPLGNIGFPGSVEEIRHFRGMLDRAVLKITSGELDRLIESLSAGKQ
jgi:hypothetical protein